MDRFVFLNGRFMPLQEASVHVSDLGIQRGFAIFDFFRTQDGQPFMLDQHLDRFERSAKNLNLNLPYSRDEIEIYIGELIRRHRYAMAGIKLVLTGGDSPDGLTPSASNFFITVQPIEFPHPSFYQKGIKLLSAEYRRDIPGVKTVNYAKVISMREELMETGASDVLFVFQGEIYETSRSNFFLVHDGRIKTQSNDILPGITRKAVLQLAREAGYLVEEGPLRVKWLFEAEEAFITGTTKKVMPVVKVDDRIIGSGRPGNMTLKLGELFAAFEKKWSALTRA